MNEKKDSKDDLYIRNYELKLGENHGQLFIRLPQRLTKEFELSKNQEINLRADKRDHTKIIIEVKNATTK